MALYLIDTNVLAALSKPIPSRAVERKVTKHLGEMVTAATVLHEMWFGIERLPRSRRRAELDREAERITSYTDALGAQTEPDVVTVSRKAFPDGLPAVGDGAAAPPEKSATGADSGGRASRARENRPGGFTWRAARSSSQ